MENTIMFIVGTIVFTLYIVGYLFMVKRQNELQQQQIKFKNSQTSNKNPSAPNDFTITSSITRLKIKKNNIISDEKKFTNVD